MKYLLLLTAVLTALTATAAFAGDMPPPITEYTRVPKGILLTPLQRAGGGVPDAPNTAMGEETIDPQVPVHTLEDVGIDSKAPVKVKIQGMSQVEAAYAEGKYEEIISPLELLVAQGDIQATLLLGIMLDQGQGAEANLDRAFSLMTQAAEAGLPLAQHRLAILYYQGRGTPKDFTRAMMWLTLAIAKYPPGAQKDRALADRANLEDLLNRRDRETGIFMAREWANTHNETQLLNDLR